MSFAFEARFFRSLLDQMALAPRRVLVVGCGAGVEVAHLADATGAYVTGIDLTVDPRWRRPNVQLVRGDALRLPFPDAAFDALYCYHVLEHVPDPARAILEARRVLRPEGAAYFGTPNKSRLVGYIGGRGSAWQKFWWNVVDWGPRLTGRWSNEQGAHAGFTSRELGRLLGASFARVEGVDLRYYLGKYPQLAGFWNTAFHLGLSRFFAPSVYFWAAGEMPRTQA